MSRIKVTRSYKFLKIKIEIQESITKISINGNLFYILDLFLKIHGF